jgi:hypothetical protein
VQQEILSKNANADLKVYAVWFNMLVGDSRRGWDGARLRDQRVTHLWDERKAVGNWFSANVTHDRGITWDFYALYGPDSADLARPTSMGGTIISRSSQLRNGIESLLGAGTPS